MFWLNNNYGMSITEMDHRIDQMSDKIIKEYKNQGHIVVIDNDAADRVKQYASKHQFFANKGRMVVYPACEDADSSGCHWRRAEPATSRHCAFPNDQGVLKSTR